jgi:hypothetical protein
MSDIFGFFVSDLNLLNSQSLKTETESSRTGDASYFSDLFDEPILICLSGRIDVMPVHHIL